ncbi:MAG: hypothetical protein K5868_04280 [Lachnospiraceae bacterium]|nr:hypothetical protein [Lachnospiraceae bacterium]
MRREVKNKKVLSAITIGLAAVIASTSIPMDVYAAVETDGPTQTSSENSGSSETGSESSSSAENDAVITADEVDAATVKTAEAAVDAAADSYENHAKSVDNDTLKADEALKKDDAAIKAEVDKANEILKNSESLNNEDLNNALVNTAVAEANIAEVQKALVGVYLEHSDKDDNEKDRLQYEVPRDENEDLVIDENNCPEVGKGKAVDQISGQYGEDSDADDGVNLKNRSVQGTYQEGMKQIQEAIKQRKDGNKDAEDAALAKANKYLKACEDKFDDSTKALADATAQYKAAKEAADAAQASYDKVQGLVETAISDTNSAEAQLKTAKDRAEKLTAIANQYYGLMIQYFSKSVGTAQYDENGKLDVEASAQAVASVTGKDKQIVEGDGLDVNNSGTYLIGRELLEQLIMYKLESEGAKEITFGATGVDGDGKTVKTKIGEEKKVSIEKDSKGKDKVALTDAGSHTQYREDGDNGRKNHFIVTYTDASGQPQTKYYNMVYKGIKYEGSNVDLTKGVCYVAEVVYDKEAKKWNYAPYSEESDFLSDYNLTKGYRDAAAEVEKAKAEVVRLRNELNALSDKVATNSSVLGELKGELDKAETALKNSKDSLKDFQDLYRYMTEGVQPSELIEEEERGDQPDVLPPSGDDVVTGDDIVTGGGDTTGGDTVLDTGDGAQVIIPGGAGIGLQGFNLATPAGVAGVNIADGGVPLAGNIQASNNKQNNSVIANKKAPITKIKDSEVPLANMPAEDGVQLNWMWLLIIFLLGATGKKMFDEYKKKKEAEEAAKLNK